MAKDRFNYPAARRSDQKDNFFGTVVSDPYRWLEDPDSAETVSWVDAEIAVTDKFLSALPIRSTLVERFKTLWNYDSESAPYTRGNRTFFSRRKGLQNQAVQFVRDEKGERVLLDPNTLSSDGTTAISAFAVSHDGNLLAYGLSYSGSDWTEIRVRDIATGEDLPDLIKWVKFSGASWSQDNRGFYYGRYAEPKDPNAPAVFQKAYFHRVGTRQSEDELIYERPDNEMLSFGIGETDDKKYVINYVSSSASGGWRFYYKETGAKEWVKLIDNADSQWTFIHNDGALFYFHTDHDAPRGRLVVVDVNMSSPGALHIENVVAEPTDSRTIFESASFVGKHFFCQYMTDVHTSVKEHNLDGSFVREVKLPGIGSASGFGGAAEDMETYYSFSSYTSPAITYKYDIATGESTVYFKPAIDVDPSKYVTKLVFATSKDGTKVPLFVSYRKGLKRNGKNPTLLYGYGGFNISLGPSFSSSRVVWMDMGGIYAEAILRGGGEYGKHWHEDGTKLKKQNVFDDFIACAEWLIANKYTSTPKLAINGGSNGGLLVGACMTQRPELYGACLPEVGVMDMLRFQKFTAGKGWTGDYGNADENEAEFKALYAYSPYHNVRQGVKYPPTLVMTADHDDRVVPGHSFKFAAALQWAQAGDAPCLIRIEKKAGHGAGKPLSKQMEEIADRYGFLIKMLDIPARKLRRVLEAVNKS